MPYLAGVVMLETTLTANHTTDMKLFRNTQTEEMLQYWYRNEPNCWFTGR